MKVKLSEDNVLEFQISITFSLSFRFEGYNHAILLRREKIVGVITEMSLKSTS